MAHEREAAGTIEVEQRDGVTVLRLAGEHDLTTRSAVQLVIERSVASDQGVVVSLSEAEFVDSNVINALFHGDASLRERGRRLVVHVATASIVARVLQLSGVSTTLPHTSSLETAVTLASAREGDPTWSSG